MSMQFPQRSNELVDEREKSFVEAVGAQHGGTICGSLHIFMHKQSRKCVQGHEHNLSTTIILNYIPDQFTTDSNLLRILRDLADWMDKQNTSKEQ